MLVFHTISTYNTIMLIKCEYRIICSIQYSLSVCYRMNKDLVGPFDTPTQNTISFVDTLHDVFTCGTFLFCSLVGKLRRKWMPTVLSDPGVEMIRAVKQFVDPKNIFASGNLLPPLDDKHLLPRLDNP